MLRNGVPPAYYGFRYLISIKIHPHFKGFVAQWFGVRLDGLRPWVWPEVAVVYSAVPRPRFDSSLSLAVVVTPVGLTNPAA